MSLPRPKFAVTLGIGLLLASTAAQAFALPPDRRGLSVDVVDMAAENQPAQRDVRANRDLSRVRDRQTGENGARRDAEQAQQRERDRQNQERDRQNREQDARNRADADRQRAEAERRRAENTRRGDDDRRRTDNDGRRDADRRGSDGNDRRGDRGGRDRDWGRSDDRRWDDRDRNDWRGRPPERFDRYDRGDRGRFERAPRRYRAPAYRAPRGFFVQRWSYGQRLPFGWYGQPYHLDWRFYGLQPAPYGAQWVRVGDDAVLVDLRSGFVLDVVYDLFW